MAAYLAPATEGRDERKKGDWRPRGAPQADGADVTSPGAIPRPTLPDKFTFCVWSLFCLGHVRVGTAFCLCTFMLPFRQRE